MTRLFFGGKKVSLRIRDSRLTYELRITNESSFAGKNFVCQCAFGGRPVAGLWTIMSGSQYASVTENGRFSVNEGVQGKEVTVRCQYRTFAAEKTFTVSYDNQLTIECAATMTGTSGNAVALYNGAAVSPAWSIISGGSYASIDAAGEISISSSGGVTLQAEYSGLTATKGVEVAYQENTTSQTTVNPDGSVTTETETVVENPDGSTTTTSQ